MSGFEQCPKCQWEVGNATECPRCGVILSKVASAPGTGFPQGVDRAPDAAPAERPARLTPLLLLIALAAVGVFAFDNATEAESELTEEGTTTTSRLQTSSKPLPPAPRVEPRLSADTYDPPRDEVEAPAPSRENERSLPANYSYDWYEGADGFRRGIEEAKRDDRPVFLYFYTDWCGYCRQLERNLLEQATVEDFTKYLVKIRVNPEKGQVERQLAQRYGVRGFPALFMHSTTDAKPLRVSRTTGGRLQRPSEFVETLRRASKL